MAKTGQSETASPMMQQYLEIKEQYPDCLLFYRMGDFYEMFFEDAVQGAAALDITLTRRGQHAGQEIPMAGVPVHAYESYLARLIRRGFRVAVCEQVETPAQAKKRAGAKALVKRDVVRIITPGTLTEDTLMPAREATYLVALAGTRKDLALAWIEMASGPFRCQPTSPAEVAADLERLAPAELLLPEPLAARPDLAQALAPWTATQVTRPASSFDRRNAEKRLKDAFGVQDLAAFGQFSAPEVASCGALLDYVQLTQKGLMPRLSAPLPLPRQGQVEIDGATRRSLELTRTQAGEREGSLLSVIDRTVTAAGARLLAWHLATPSTDIGELDARLDAVAHFVRDPGLTERVRGILKGLPDISRALGRLSLGRGGPRDLLAVARAAQGAVSLRGSLPAPLPQRLADAVSAIGDPSGLIDTLTATLEEEPPLLARDGGFVRPGAHAALDEIRRLRDDSRSLMAELQGQYNAETGIPALKIRHNNILGFYIEVSAKAAAPLMEAPLNRTFIHRQTMANAVRFTTDRLMDLAGKLEQAADRALALELDLFADLVAQVLAQGDALDRLAQSLAVLDVAAALAQVALDRDYTRPLLEESRRLEIVGGRHPVVEAAAGPGAPPFVANDCHLSADQTLWLLTGPNMAGKSTFLRQTALIVVLAQIGSFVPATSARIGVVDRLYSRVGAADDLARGRSTFMVEMVETATILNRASERSLVILDEIGRGTATFDGLSIAWACVEHLHDRLGCRCLFATHYHELTQLAQRLERLSARTMAITEHKGDLVFLHRVLEGTADRSYGIHVARLAGLPGPVVKRAGQVLESLEKSAKPGSAAELLGDLPLFAAWLESPPPPPDPDPTQAAAPLDDPLGDSLRQRLEAIDPDQLSPREALDILYALKREIP